MENENTQLPTEEKKKEECCDNKKCKCCINLYLNIIAIAGVIVLFILYFTGKPRNSHASKHSSNSSMNIAFVNSDSLMANFELVKTVKSALEAKQKEAEDNFASQQKDFQSQVTQYQQNVQANKLTNMQAQDIEKNLSQKQQELLNLKDELTQKLSEEEMKMNTMLQDTIMNFLKKYNKKHNYDYILGFARGSGILYANDGLEITNEVVKELNMEYKATRKDK